MKANTKIFQSRDAMNLAALELGIYSHTNYQHDFLACCQGETFGRTDTYFFKTVSQISFKEVRFFIKSKRVTTSKYKSI